MRKWIWKTGRKPDYRFLIPSNEVSTGNSESAFARNRWLAFNEVALVVVVR